MYSFFIYVAHAPLMRIIWIVFQKELPYIPVPFFTAVAPFAVTTICIGIYKSLSALAPRPLDWVLGSRGNKAYESKSSVLIPEKTIQEPLAKAES